MATDESREERLARLEQRIAERDRPNISTAEELGRAEEARAARHFEFRPPAFRTSVKLRFFGEGVKGHDLPGSVAGALIGGISEVVDAAAHSFRMPKKAAELYLSPVVSPGSTIVELFGPAPDELPQDKLDAEIDDTLTDSILKYVFALLELVNSVPLAKLQTVEVEISRQLGKKLFSLSKDLIDTQVDLDIIWTRPRGTSQTAGFTRTTAAGFRALLDMEKVETVSRTENGTLKQISTEGKIGFEYQEKNRTRSITLDNEALDDERLRGLWAREVRLSWTEQTTSHPRRSSTKVVRTVTGAESV
jgi:hypothetical protein